MTIYSSADWTDSCPGIVTAGKVRTDAKAFSEILRLFLYAIHHSRLAA